MQTLCKTRVLIVAACALAWAQPLQVQAQRTSALPTATAADTADLVEIVDVSDTTTALTGRNKKITLGNFSLSLPALNASALTTGTVPDARLSGNVLLGTGAYADPAWLSALSWTKLTGKPTTISGFGITDAQPLDPDLVSIAALSTTAFGRGLLTETDATTIRATLGLDSRYYTQAQVDASLAPITTDVSTLKTSSASGLDAAKFKGDVTSLSQALVTASGNAGAWYYITVSGTLSGTNSQNRAVQAGGYLFSDGTNWTARGASIAGGNSVGASALQSTALPAYADYWPDPDFRSIPGGIVRLIGTERQRVWAITAVTTYTYTFPLPADFASGDKFCATFRVKSDSANFARTFVGFYDNTDTLIGAVSDVRNGTTVNQFVDCRHDLTVPSGTVTVKMSVQRASGGEVQVQKIMVHKGRFQPRSYPFLNSVTETSDSTQNYGAGFITSIGNRDVGNGKRAISGAGTSASLTPALPGTYAAGDVLWLTATMRAQSLAVSIRIIAFDAAGVSIGTSSSAVASSATWQRAALSGASYTLPSNTASIKLQYFGSASGAQYEIADVEITKENPLGLRLIDFASSSSSPVLATKTVYLGKVGMPVNASGPYGTVEGASDITGTGGSRYPFATLQKCVDTLQGSGTVIIYNLPGYEISATDLQLIPNTALNLRILVAGDGGVIKGGNALANITKTTGQTKVYQAAYTITSGVNGTDIPWIWEDGTNEAGTLIPASEKHALTRARTHRLPSTRIVRTTATTLAAALAEIDGAATPKYFWDSSTNTIYFSHTGGATTPTKGIYVPTGKWTGWGTLQSLEVANLHVRYTPLPVPDAYAHATNTCRAWNCSVIGSPDSYNFGNNFEAINCEFAGSARDGYGSANSRGHHTSCWYHDNADDGYSNHFTASETVIGCVSEYNYGAGFIPAAGASCKLVGCGSRKNAITGSAKQGGFVALEATTYVECYNCWSDGDKTGFVGANGGSMRAMNCFAENSTGKGFDSAVTTDCRTSAEGTPSTATAKNGALVN